MMHRFMTLIFGRQQTIIFSRFIEYSFNSLLSIYMTIISFSFNDSFFLAYILFGLSELHTHVGQAISIIKL